MTPSTNRAKSVTKASVGKTERERSSTPRLSIERYFSFDIAPLPRYSASAEGRTKEAI